jgi:hypothetical protein
MVFENQAILFCLDLIEKADRGVGFLPFLILCNFKSECPFVAII